MTVEYDRMHNIYLLNFFVDRKMEDFVKSVYDRKNHQNRTQSAREAECITMKWMLHYFLMHSDDPSKDVQSAVQAYMEFVLRRLYEMYLMDVHTGEDKK